MKDEVYLFHQTPNDLAKNLINFVPLITDDKVLEPFRGEGSFYNNFPEFTANSWCEIEEGIDFKDFDYDTSKIDWVISNPPFRLENLDKKRINSFYFILDFFLKRVNKGIAFLGNDYCFATLTPKRINEIEKKGFYINKIVVCNVKKWRGRYFFIIISKIKTDFYNYIEGSY